MLFDILDQRKFGGIFFFLQPGLPGMMANAV